MFSRTDRSTIGLWWWTVDKWLLFLFFMLGGLGVYLVFAASPPVAERIGFDNHHFIYRHMIFLMLALGMMLITSMASLSQVRGFSILGFLGAIALMLLAITLGPEIKGATRWISLGSFKLQPSEFVKPCFAIVVAWLLNLWREEKILPFGWLITLTLLLIVCTLLILQPDTGMTFVILATWAMQIFLAGIPIPTLMILAIFIAPITGLLLYFLLPHVQTRIEKFLGEGSLQAENAIRSFAHGGGIGVGPGNGELKYNLPDAHSDFIFAVAGEEGGMFLCIILIAIYAAIALYGFKRAFLSENLFLILAIAGLSMQIGLQAAVHIASTTDLIPTKGMTLPFISYGGSSLLATSITMGFILAMTKRNVSGYGAKNG